MERNRLFRSISLDLAHEDADHAREERDLKTLTDLELMLAAGGDDIVCWDPPK
jgi:hypothetical protein